MSEASENANIKSVALSSLGNIVGSIGASSFIVNDYLLTITEVDGGYTLSITKGSQTQTAFIRDAVSIESIEQITASEEDHGLNTIRVTLSDGNTYDFDYYNGSKGSQGDPGLSEEEKQAIFDAETQRQNAESIRQGNESSRQSAETDRQLFESLRRSEEAERVQQEKNRRSAETARETAESARNGAENLRNYNEGERESAEQIRQSEWTLLKKDLNTAISEIVELRENVETLSDKVDGASDDVLEAYVNVNNEIDRMEDILTEVEVAATSINGMIAKATTLSPSSSATATYENGVLTIGIPKGDTGDSFHIVKTYSSVYEMESDYYGGDVNVGDFVMIASTVEDPDNAKIYVKGSSQFVFVVDMSGATGIKGDKGDKGDTGFAPVVTVKNIDGGHKVSITDNTSTKEFNVIDGVDGTSVTAVSFQIDSNGVLKYLVSIQ